MVYSEELDSLFSAIDEFRLAAKGLEEKNKSLLCEVRRLYNENGLLRDLVIDIFEDQCVDADKWKYQDRMQELGIEVA